MKKLAQFLSYVIVALAACALTLYLTAPKVTKLDQLEALINQRFIGEHDTVAMEDAAAKAMIGALGDRWTQYIPAASFAAYQEQSDNSFVGIDVTITYQEDPAGLLIMTVNAGGGAADAGLLPGDLIRSIEGQSTDGMTTGDARNLIRGEAGTFVVLGVLRDGTEFDVSVQRKNVLTVVASGEMINDKVGLVTIANFDSRCAQESIAAIEALREAGAEALIFDVRSNHGGYAHELVALLDYLLPEGDLFRTLDYQGKETLDRSDAACLDMPMAVLCSENSISAAEFFVAALQEYKAAVVVGTPTCGKGYFQQTYPLIDGSAVALSVGKYFTPKGNSLIGTGVVPDISVPVDEETAISIYYGVLEPDEDPQIQAALNALK